MKNKTTLLSDPSLDHLDSKLIVGLLILVLIGILTGILIASDEEKTWRRYSRMQRTVRMQRVPRPFRRKDVAYY